MALQVERQLTIINLIKNNKTVRVDELTKVLKVSSNTIRRDLSQLEKQGVLRRTQGGAILTEVDNNFTQPFEIRETKYTTEKKAIGRKASELVGAGDTIIIDAGTTALQLAKNLFQRQNLTILTNSLEISYELIANPNIVIILSGGIIRESSRSLIGLPAEQFFSQVHADKLFLATGGLTITEGLTNPNMHETPIKRNMIESAKEVIVLADFHKFGRISLSTIAPVTKVHKVVTDKKAPKEIINKLETLGIEVIIADE